jgi:hypothetical protein
MEKENAFTPEESQKEGVRPVKKLNRMKSFFHGVVVGDYFSRDSFFKTIPYLGYLTILAIIYISNTYYAEKTLRKIEIIKSEMKELRFQYISSKSELMYYGKQTEIVKRVIPAGLKETKIPPFKIFYDKDSLNTKGKEIK